MGKLQSKHVCRSEDLEGQCILVDTQINHHGTEISSLDSDCDQGSEITVSVKQCFNNNLSNNNNNNNMKLSEDQIPLRVVLPPLKKEIDKENFDISTDMNGKCKLDTSTVITTDENRSNLNVEEIECGVSVAGSDKQEWSFTLYNLEGQSQVTKEDLGGLLKALYDAVGPSLTLPESGTKTLKLRLSLTPENGAVNHKQKENCLNKNSKINKRTVNNCLLASSKTNKESPREKKLTNLNRVQHCPSKPLHQNDLNTPKQESTRHDPLCKISGVTSSKKIHLDENNLSRDHQVSGKPRISKAEKRHLAELVQKNMERHQRRQKQIKRHNSDGAYRPRHYITSRRIQSLQKSAPCQESQERRNYYLDLAGIDHELIKPDDVNKTSDSAADADNKLPKCSPKGTLDTVHEVEDFQKEEISPIKDWIKQPRRHKRSHTVGHSARHNHKHAATDNLQHSATVNSITNMKERQLLIEKAVEEALGQVEPEKEMEVSKTESADVNKSVLRTGSGSRKGERPVSLPLPVPESVSPHHHRRHRHREKNRQTAMRQVAEWIEAQQNWTEVPCTEVEPEPLLDLRTVSHSSKQAIVALATSNNDSRVRHEHRHLHEHHHHHHYHHYIAT